MKLTSRILKSEQEFADYALNYEQYSKTKLDVLYLKQLTLIRGFYSKNNILLAGYTFNTNKPLRYYKDMSNILAAQKNLPNEDEVAEGGSLWISHKLTSYQRCKLYLISLIDFYRLRKKFFMIGSKHPNIAKIEKKIFPHIIYETDPGVKPYLCYMYATRWEVPKMIIYFIYRYCLHKPCKNLLQRLTKLKRMKSAE